MGNRIIYHVAVVADEVTQDGEMDLDITVVVDVVIITIKVIRTALRIIHTTNISHIKEIGYTRTFNRSKEYTLKAKKFRIHDLQERMIILHHLIAETLLKTTKKNTMGSWRKENSGMQWLDVQQNQKMVLSTQTLLMTFVITNNHSFTMKRLRLLMFKRPHSFL